MVEPAFEVDGVCHDIDQDYDLMACPAQNEATTDHERRDESIASCLVNGCSTHHSSNLTSHQAGTT